MEPDVPAIVTERLELVSMSLPFMEACLARDLAGAELALGATIPETFPDGLDDFFRFRIADLRDDPSIRPWLGRALVLKNGDGRLVVGSAGFHAAPGPDGRVEIGYQIDPAFRRQGYATEAVVALLDWARREHGVRRFRAATSPGNAISQRILAGLGFLVTGRQWDEVDGEEVVFELDDADDDGTG